MKILNAIHGVYTQKKKIRRILMDYSKYIDNGRYKIYRIHAFINKHRIPKNIYRDIIRRTYQTQDFKSMVLCILGYILPPYSYINTESNLFYNTCLGDIIFITSFSKIKFINTKINKITTIYPTESDTLNLLEKYNLINQFLPVVNLRQSTIPRGIEEEMISGDTFSHVSQLEKRASICNLLEKYTIERERERENYRLYNPHTLKIRLTLLLKKS